MGKRIHTVTSVEKLHNFVIYGVKAIFEIPDKIVQLEGIKKFKNIINRL